MATRKGRRLAVATVAIALGGCAALPIAPPGPILADLNLPHLGAATGAALVRIPPLSGRVVWPARQAQSTMADVATRATVTLIDTSNNNSVGSTLSGPDGAFSIDLARGFVPASGRLYYVEAYKGLLNNRVGQDAARVRTVVQFSAGWSSLTGGGPVALTRGTTSLAALMDLKGLDAEQRAALMGRVAADGTPPAYDDNGAAVTRAEFLRTYDLVTTALTGDRDPVDSLRWVNGQVVLRPGIGLSGPQLVEVVPPQGGQGHLVAVFGTDFDSALAGNAVDFGGVAATPSALVAGRMEVVVPQGARSGPLTVTTRLGSGSIAFTVLPTVSGAFVGL
ncbi:MAG: hypothetical protein FJZ01_11360 [Candidatus Sericytochromatia bacterium]|nr:hypothetical protein [Candidatus Tanganyikabacteria bacterium]